jgi:Gluconate 2-dehydrogenase subunit 3
VPDMRRTQPLPNLRAGAEPPRPDLLPRQRAGTTPQMIGRFPDYDVLASVDDWDAATRRIVTARLRLDGTFSFFALEQRDTLGAFCDVVLAQDAEPRVPVAELVDAKLAEGRLDGYQYDDMPDDRDTWRQVLDGLDAIAGEWHGQESFASCAPLDRHGIVEAFSAGRLAGGPWERLAVAHAWEVCTRMMLEAFYSHPWAWNEIGFGGPAYPQGYMRLGPLSTLEPRERPGATDEDAVRAAAELKR